MEFQDRISRYPNRYLLTDENNNEKYVYLERADEPTEEGTPLNAATLTSMLFGLESKKYPGCYYRDVNGAEEWINPPMISGVHYRTAKRFGGKPVLTVAYAIPHLWVGFDEESEYVLSLGFSVEKIVRYDLTIISAEGNVFHIDPGFTSEPGNVNFNVSLKDEKMTERCQTTDVGLRLQSSSVA